VSPIEQLQLDLGGMLIPYQLRVNPRAKHIRLRIDANGLRVLTPAGVKREDVEQLLREKSQWIRKYHQQFQAVPAAVPKREWRDGETLLYQGERYPIAVRLRAAARTVVEFNGAEFEIGVNGAAGEKERAAALERAVIKWYLKAAGEAIAGRLAHYQRLTGLVHGAVRIKAQKSRWGSCSRQGNLNFNWKLVLAPGWVLDYVVVHEICHLRHLNHSRDFWKLVAAVYPDYQSARQWLRKNGPELLLY
jgi:predicted metal-dependent hydrolase